MTEPARTQIWPVYSGKSFNLWQPDTGRYYDSVEVTSIRNHLQSKRLNSRRFKSSAFAQQDSLVTDDPSTLPCLFPRIAYRRIAHATNRRTFVVALLPPDRVLQESITYFLLLEGSRVDEAYVLGVLASMPCDWQLRRMGELTLSFAITDSLTVPDPGEGHPVRDRVAKIAGQLAAVDQRFAEWAAEVGVPVGSVTDEAVKYDLLAELDACVGLLYGLDEDDLAVIYDTFHTNADYSEHEIAVLAHFKRWSGLLAEKQDNSV